jgi:CDP-diacylglycerol--glycerol-3-phosphate 3-phosphatidyltransferase
MITTTELIITLLIALLIPVFAAAYGLRVAVKGRVHFDRIDRQGGSRLLSKGMMELGYWMLQPAARFFVFVGVTPNQLSWASLGFGFVSGACLAQGRFGFGAVFATIAGLLDSLDGMVARISGAASDAGEVLDAAIDRYVEFFFLSGLIIYYREILVLQVLALLALAGSFMFSYSTSQAAALKVDLPRASMRRPERTVYLTLGAALSAVTIPWLEASRESSIAIGYPMVVSLGLVAVVANACSLERFKVIARAIRLREKTTAEARTQAAEVLIEGEDCSRTGRHAASIRHSL